MATIINNYIVTIIILRIIGDLPNTYSFTKSLAEDVIRREAQGLPILVFRPTVGMYFGCNHCIFVIGVHVPS